MLRNTCQTTLTMLCFLLVSSGTEAQQSSPVTETILKLKDSQIQSNEGLVVIEAEHYVTQGSADHRRWIVFNDTSPALHGFADNDPLHVQGASQNSYIELLPDTRTHHSETLVEGRNFSAVPGQLAVIAYPIHFQQSGRYYIWARAYSSGSEDNGVHIGIDAQWPVSSQRLQLCKGKNRWTWSSNQRDQQNHCGTPNTIWLDIPNEGLHTLKVSMREDGFELDKLILTQDPSYVPSGKGPKETRYFPGPIKQKTRFFNINEYSLILIADKEFSSDGKIPFYYDRNNEALAIDARVEAYRDIWVSAELKVSDEIWGKKPTDERKFNQATLVTLGEVDGESSYRVFLNKELIAQVTNKETSIDYQENYFQLGPLTLKPDDILRVEAKAVTNGKIPENGGTAFARGRWRGIILRE